MYGILFIFQLLNEMLKDGQLKIDGIGSLVKFEVTTFLCGPVRF